MSRCFPYPPPGYTLSRASNEALIESIKLQREREKAKSERKKEKKRDKKEKKKIRKEKAKLNASEHNLYEKDGRIIQQERKDETEQLERSSITEEHEQPICPQNPSYLSDSTQNSNKRKRHSPTLDGTRVQGNILRIRLPSQKHLKLDIQDGENPRCSTSGRTDSPEDGFFATRTDPDKCCSTSMATDTIDRRLPARLDKELSQPNFQHLPITHQENINSDNGSKRFKKLNKVVQRYNNLIENWNPPSHLSEYMEADDQEWLFGRNHQDKTRETKDKVINQVSCSSSSTLWPRAQYIPDAGIYALPFTVPF